LATTVDVGAGKGVNVGVGGIVGKGGRVLVAVAAGAGLGGVVPVAEGVAPGRSCVGNDVAVAAAAVGVGREVVFVSSVAAVLVGARDVGIRSAVAVAAASVRGTTVAVGTETTRVGVWGADVGATYVPQPTMVRRRAMIETSVERRCLQCMGHSFLKAGYGQSSKDDGLPGASLS